MRSASGEDRRIALFTSTLGGGGAERVLVNLASALAAHGHRAELVLSSAAGPYRDQVPASVPVVDLCASRTIYAVPHLARYLAHARPAALLSALDTANVTALAARALARVPTRVVVSIHSPLRVQAAGAVGFVDRWVPRLTRWTYAAADAVVAVSKGVGDELAAGTRIPPQRIRVIYNPVVTSSLLAKAEAPLDHPWFVPGGPPVFLGVGRLTPQKDFDTLVRAFARVRALRPARLLVLGEGELRPALEARVRTLGIGDDASLPGFVANPYAYLSRAGAFVLSSAWEALPTVLIEALACGTPVVSTRCRFGPDEILEGGLHGPLVPVGDDEALAKAMLAVLERPPSREVLRRRADAFSDEACLADYLEVLLGSSADARCR